MRRRAAQEPVEIDVLQKKKEELAKFVDQYNDAVSQLFGIGQHRLREIMKDDYNCIYHLTVGRVIKVKRKPFEEYISKAEQI